MLSDLMDLAKEPSSDRRRELLGRIAGIFLDEKAQYLDAEMFLFCEILIKLVDQVDAEARAALSAGVAASDRGSRELHLRLANDEIAVAEPVLRCSSKLEDNDLVEVAERHSQEHLLAISRRASLSAAVTDVLVERGQGDVLQSVTSNLGAEISESGFYRLVEKSEDDADLQAALSFRGDMPPGIADRLMTVLPLHAQNRLSELVKTSRPLATSMLSAAMQKVGEQKLDRRRQRIETRGFITDVRAGRMDLDDLLIRLATQDRAIDVALVLADFSTLTETIVNHSLLRVDSEPLAILLRSLPVSLPAVEAVAALRCRRLKLPDTMRARLVSSWRELEQDAAARALRFTKLRSSN